VVVPLTEHPLPKGIYFDDCAPHYHMRLAHIVAILVGMLLWLVLIIAAIAIYRALKG
jgi:hypothetical protein